MRRKQRRSPHEAFVVVRETTPRLSVVFLSERAKAHGVMPGMTLAEARAVCPDLKHAVHEPLCDIRSLENLGRWMNRFSPHVATESGDALLLDVTGSERLFGGFETIARVVLDGVTKLGFTCRVAIAPTPGAAWAIASFGTASPVVIDEGELVGALSPLPVSALRISDDLAGAFRSLGVDTVKQLTALPRNDLPARFGKEILIRLDQAFGQVFEPLIAVRSRNRITAALEFEHPLESLEIAWEAFRQLIADVRQELMTRGRGVKRLMGEFVPEHSAPIRKEIHCAEPSVDASALLNMLRCAGESITSSAGFIRLSLTVLASETLTTEQLNLLDRRRQAERQEFSHLVERLRLRLGTGAVARPHLNRSYLPEKAFGLAGVLPGAFGSTSAAVSEIPLKSRPLHLFAEPTEVRCILSPSSQAEGLPASFVYQEKRFDMVWIRGPERIAGVWWEGRNKTRDYFDGEDASGRRFWLFRVVETRKWYLHGIFDC